MSLYPNSHPHPYDGLFIGSGGLKAKTLTVRDGCIDGQKIAATIMAAIPFSSDRRFFTHFPCEGTCQQ
jgi:hypothetical protein